MSEEVLRAIEDIDSLSFYGLVHWLTKVSALITRIEAAASAKAPRAADAELSEHKEELLDAQSRLRRAIGSSLENPSLTKRERPLAEDFLKEQLSKLQAQSQSDERAVKGIERLRQILQKVQTTNTLPESKTVRDIEASMKDLELEWKEVSPIYDKWQAGRHSFKSNADLQAFKRRYEDCKKSRDSIGPKLEEALHARRSQCDIERKSEVTKLDSAWSAIAKKQATPSPAQVRANAIRGSAAIAVDAAAKKKTAPAKSNAWGSSMISFAQCLRADLVQQVRQEASEDPIEHEVCEVAPEVVKDNHEQEDDDVFWEAKPVLAKDPPAKLLDPPHSSSPSRPAVTTRIKQAATAKAMSTEPSGIASSTNRRRWAGQVEDDAVEQEEAFEQENVRGPDNDDAKKGDRTKHAPLSKKNNKNKALSVNKKKTTDEEECNLDHLSQNNDPGPATRTQSTFASRLVKTFSDSLVQELIRPDSWVMSGTAVDTRLAELKDRLSLSSPLGLVLSVPWHEFLSLEVDGGPIRTSKRGQSPAAIRLQKNIPALLGNYIVLVFFLTFLHSLSHFGLALLPFFAQVVLVLIPPGQVPRLGTQAQLVLLQVAHALLWLCFARALVLMHLLVKILLMSLLALHAYIVAEVR
jgi:hypothetical protein